MSEKPKGETSKTVEAEDDFETRTRTKNVIESLELLGLYEPKLLKGIEEARREQVPLPIYVTGFEHSADVALAVLRCAHAYGVTLTFVPHPVVDLPDNPFGAHV